MDVLWIPFATQFDNNCMVCGRLIRTGEECEWLKANGIRHFECGNFYDKAMNLRDNSLRNFVNGKHDEAKKLYKLSEQVLTRIDLVEQGSKLLKIGKPINFTDSFPWPKNEDLKNEFKSSWQIDIKAEEILKSKDKFAIKQIESMTGKRIKDMKKDVIKTVCGFLNNVGGSIWLGVSNNAEPLGLEKDLRKFNKPGKNSRDLLGQDIMNKIRTHLERDFPTEITFKDHQIDEEKKEKIVLEVLISPLGSSGPPAYFTDDKERIPFVRLADGDHAYKDLEKWMSYVKKRFPDFVI